jgi:hypothetical protein
LATRDLKVEGEGADRSIGFASALICRERSSDFIVTSLIACPSERSERRTRLHGHNIVVRNTLPRPTFTLTLSLNSTSTRPLSTGDPIQ